MRTIVWITIATLAASYLLFAYVTLDRRGDEAQLESLFAQTAQAVEKRNLSGTIGCVSKNYKDPADLNYDSLRMLTAQALQVEKKYDVDYKLLDTKINGDTATVRVNLAVNQADGKAALYRRIFTVTLTKENGRHALIIPTKVWRVTSIDRLGAEFEDGL